MDNLSKPYNNPHLSADSWRVFRIVAELVDGFETMMDLGPSVTVFGSARAAPETINYNMAVSVAQCIAKKGFSIITGGGPGIMEAANKGAQSVGGNSCGVNIDLPLEEDNAFIDPKFKLHFRYFFIRKVMFIRYAQGYVFLPGGYGTLDELFEALTLIQTEKIRKFPIYLMGSSYWTGLMGWLTDTVLAMNNISSCDLELIRITDDPNEVADGIEAHYQKTKNETNF